MKTKSENKTMTMSEKISLTKASITLADFWGVEPTDILSFVAMMHKDKKEEWNKIAKEVVEFENSPLEKRAELMGIKLVKEHHEV